MKIKLSSIYASSFVTAHPGSVIDVSAEEGKQLVDGRFGVEVPSAESAPSAEPVPPVEGAGDVIETATAEPPKNAATRTGPRRDNGRTTKAKVPPAEEAKE